jgi:hypothetical protein
MFKQFNAVHLPGIFTTPPKQRTVTAARWRCHFYIVIDLFVYGRHGAASSSPWPMMRPLVAAAA